MLDGKGDLLRILSFTVTWGDHTPGTEEKACLLLIHVFAKPVVTSEKICSPASIH